MRRSYRIAPVVAALLMFGGCYHFRLDTSAPQGTEIKSRTMHAFLWGLVQPSAIDSCGDNGVTDVRVTTNYAYQLFSVVTLGIWVPMDVEFRCTKLPPPKPDDQ